MLNYIFKKLNILKIKYSNNTMDYLQFILCSWIHRYMFKKTFKSLIYMADNVVGDHWTARSIWMLRSGTPSAESTVKDPYLLITRKRGHQGRDCSMSATPNPLYVWTCWIRTIQKATCLRLFSCQMSAVTMASLNSVSLVKCPNTTQRRTNKLLLSCYLI